MSKPMQFKVISEGKFSLEPQEIDPSNPKLEEGDYLVRMEYAAINPSDFLFTKGLYAHAPPPVNSVTGFEGSGEVVKAGPGADPSLVGRKVLVLSYSGVHCNYKIAKRDALTLLQEDHYNKHSQTHFFINPITVLGMLELVLERKAKAVIQNGAAANTGRLFTVLCKRYGVPIINIVRSEEHRDLMNKLGATDVLVRSHPDFEKNLQAAVKKYNIDFAFDCVSGEDTGLLVNNMPPGGTVMFYGVLSGKPITGINPGILLFNTVKLEGFHLVPSYLAHKPAGFAEGALRQFYSDPIDVFIETEEISLDKIESALETFANKKKKYIVKF